MENEDIKKSPTGYNDGVVILTRVFFFSFQISRNQFISTKIKIHVNTSYKGYFDTP